MPKLPKLFCWGTYCYMFKPPKRGLFDGAGLALKGCPLKEGAPLPPMVGLKGWAMFRLPKRF